MNSTNNIPENKAIFTFDSFNKTNPAAVKALLEMGKAVDETGLDKHLTELIKLRASQINGCAFCTQMHLNVARKIGVDAAKLDLVAAWRDADLFSPREKAALAWTEHLTCMAHSPIAEDAYARLQLEFSTEETAHLTVAIANINAWNRIAGALRFPRP